MKKQKGEVVVAEQEPTKEEIRIEKTKAFAESLTRWASNKIASLSDSDHIAYGIQKKRYYIVHDATDKEVPIKIVSDYPKDFLYIINVPGFTKGFHDKEIAIECLDMYGEILREIVE